MSNSVRAALRERYCKPEWSIFFEVSNGTGARSHRYADAVAMNLFPSRGLEVHGFEIKTYRSDWLRELKNPEKAEAVFKYCNRWWIVAEKGLVKPGELPPTWGLIEHNAGKLRQDTEAPKLSPIPMDKTFSAIVREWDRLSKLYERDHPTGRSDELYEAMQVLIDEGRVAAGWVKTGHGSWEKKQA
jgi:hypothetical protein